MRFRKAERKGPELEIAPFIDVVFLLLIFFLLSSSFVIQPGIKIKLPQAATAESQSEKNIFILIDAKEKIYLNARQVEGRELKTELERIISEGGKKTAIIQADEKVQHGLVVGVMDTAKQVGIEKLAIATQPREVIPEKKSR
ncbi:TPA: biopolymer transporter ExbD [bacterium]|nr:biopolymer transporter ExbD [bacterium]